MKTDTSPLEKTGILPGPTSISALAVALLSFIFIKLISFIAVESYGYQILLWQNAALFALIASALSVPFKLPNWWPFIYLTFSFVFVILQGHDIPTWLFPTAVFLLIVLNWNSFGDRVPLYLSNPKTVESLSLLVEESSEGIIYDLGCGIGSAIIPLSELHPDKKFIGVETAPLSWLICIVRAHFKNLKNLKIKRQSIWNSDLKDASLVYVFLSPQPMDRIIDKCLTELNSGSTIVSNSFDSHKNPAPEMIQLYDQRETKLLIWEIK